MSLWKGMILIIKRIEIKDDYITLGQFLKLSNCISTGGEAKFFLQENTILVNNELENRRGRKLYQHDVIQITGFGQFEVGPKM